MVAIVCALAGEASPLSRHLNLRRCQKPTPFPLFQSQDFRLVVSGVGKVRSAAATAYLLSLGPSETVLNIGLAAAPGEIPIGEALLIHKVTDRATGGVFYPDVLVRHGFREAPLTTADRPQTTPWATPVDMEASGFCQAAAHFVSSAQTGLVKVVSDHFEAHTDHRIDRLLHPHLDGITELARQMQQLVGELAPGLEEPLQHLLEDLSVRIGFTVTQSRDLEKFVLYRELVEPGSASQILTAYLDSRAESKTDVRNLYHQLSNSLLPTEL